MSSATTAAEEGEGAPEEGQGMARLEFSAEGVPALVDGGVVLDNPALMEFFARAVASYSIPGQDGIQSGKSWRNLSSLHRFYPWRLESASSDRYIYHVLKCGPSISTQ